MHGKYAFVLHCKGRLCIFDMKKKKMAADGSIPISVSRSDSAI